MSNTASLELCKTLWELSGWDTHESWWVSNKKDPKDPTVERLWTLNLEFWDKIAPAYDLGYLLRNIRKNLTKRGSLRLECEEWGFRTSFKSQYDDTYQTAQSPEDCVAALAIELLKSGVIDATGKGSGTTHRANTEPVESKHTAFQTRLATLLTWWFVDNENNPPNISHFDRVPKAAQEITEALRETIPKKPNIDEDWRFWKGWDEHETALLEAIGGTDGTRS